MARIMLVCALLIAVAASRAPALELPFVTLGFQLGFNVTVVPAEDDASRDLGLLVATAVTAQTSPSGCGTQE